MGSFMGWVSIPYFARYSCSLQNTVGLFLIVCEIFEYFLKFMVNIYNLFLLNYVKQILNLILNLTCKYDQECRLLAFWYVTFHFNCHPVHRLEVTAELDGSHPQSRIPVSGGILDETDFFCAIEAKLLIRGQRGLKVKKLFVIFIRTALEKE